MNRVVVACEGVPPELGAQAALDIQQEFEQHRTWHRHVSCTWDGERLILSTVSDRDPKGLALVDEFSDTISAYITGGFDGDIKVISVEEA